jgi:hypothetical protein
MVKYMSIIENDTVQGISLNIKEADASFLFIHFNIKPFPKHFFPYNNIHLT